MAPRRAGSHRTLVSRRWHFGAGSRPDDGGRLLDKPMKMLSIAGLGLCSLLGVPAASAQVPEPWRILILNDAAPSVLGAAVQEEALRTSLMAGSQRPVQFHVEFLDRVSFDLTRYESELVALLRRKHEGVRMDLVVTIGPVGLDFAERHRDEM